MARVGNLDITKIPISAGVIVTQPKAVQIDDGTQPQNLVPNPPTIPILWVEEPTNIDYLSSINKIYLEETSNILTVGIRNFSIKNEKGEHIFKATANSQLVNITNSNNEEIIRVTKVVAGSVLCCCGRGDTIKIECPPSNVIGTVTHIPSCCKLKFEATDAYNKKIATFLRKSCCNDSNDYTIDFLETNQSSTLEFLSYYSDNISLRNVLGLNYPNSSISVKTKALLLGAIFLTGYCFFQPIVYRRFGRSRCRHKSSFHHHRHRNNHHHHHHRHGHSVGHHGHSLGHRSKIGGHRSFGGRKGGRR